MTQYSAASVRIAVECASTEVMTRRPTPTYFHVSSRRQRILFYPFLSFQPARNSAGILVCAQTPCLETSGGLRRRLWQVQPRLDVT